MLRRVSRRMHHLQADIAQFKCLAIVDSVEWAVSARGVEEHVLRAAGLRQGATGRYMVRVDVGVDHIEDAHAGFGGGLNVGSRIANGIDHHTGRFASAADQVRGSHRIGVQELTEDHDVCP